ncbi:MULTISPECIES: response regulator [Pseudanabaena]|uniref:Response regulator receiver protein n=2 Tax=Pseudanabaena TaxID=1152 RepID=L8MVC6_9CYAN|nr:MULTISPECIES: response regulator [Pseudanabaena]ELS30420.1 response regulator receiver protein [Pseudanabaena biceps PCC 7429]MDG3497299.1 response regulator [Pseudanabaena catenata USMAC16]
MEVQNFQVLIVDDNEINRDMLARRLHRRDFQISMAVNGREAIEMAQKNLYDLVLLDIMMPELDGYAVLTYLKKDSRLRDIPVIMISAIEEMGSVMKCMEIGADDYLTKPFDPEMLKAAINRCLPDRSKMPTTPIIPERPISRLPNSNFVESNTQISELKLPEDTTNGKLNNVLSLDEVVHRIMQTGTISRKGYLYFSKAIFNTLFENSGLTDQEVYQIRSVFEAIQSRQVKVVDFSSNKI